MGGLLAELHVHVRLPQSKSLGKLECFGKMKVWNIKFRVGGKNRRVGPFLQNEILEWKIKGGWVA